MSVAQLSAMPVRDAATAHAMFAYAQQLGGGPGQAPSYHCLEAAGWVTSFVRASGAPSTTPRA